MQTQDAFNARPQVKKKLNVLPGNPQQPNENAAVAGGRFPSWLHRPLPSGGNIFQTASVLESQRLHTVCEEAKCPNRWECWSRKTATFLVLGKECTRACGFCDIATSPHPLPVDPDEPRRVALSVKALDLIHVVITMVARDDLADGGASHLSQIIAEIRQYSPSSTIEVLSSDLGGEIAAWDTLLEGKPEIFNHNIETVRRLTPRVRHRATYDRTLKMLAYANTNKRHPNMLTKSGIMVGLGETEDEVLETIKDLKDAGCDIITIGQYLQPNQRKLLVKSFITPEQFEYYADYGRSIGVRHMYCGPFVRSSYNADIVLQQVSTT